MRHLIVGTAGHIDHGKTTLVKALTGTDTDRLKEEKERGISIELGFAFLSLPDGTQAGIVDVPGHERFVKTMVAGVGGIDLVVLVIGADEGVMPQTREHLHICELLHVKQGLVALTKADLVEAEWLEMVQADVTEFLKGTFLDGCPVVPCSGTTGQGLPALLAAIQTQAAAAEPKRTQGILRLPVDRVFSIKGFGTVVTGTLWSGSLTVGDEVAILPRDLRSRVRRLQVHGETVERGGGRPAHRGERAGAGGGGDRAGRCPVPSGHAASVALVRGDAVAPGGCPPAARQPRAGALPPGNQRDPRPGGDPGGRRTAAGGAVLRPFPPGDAVGRLAGRSLRHPQLFAGRHDRRRQHPRPQPAEIPPDPRQARRTSAGPGTRPARRNGSNGTCWPRGSRP